MKHQHNIQVLIAEDDFLILEMLDRALQKGSYNVVGKAVNGVEAVEMTQSLRPDVVVMDIKMPRMDGLEAARRIRNTCPTPIVVLTAYDTRELIAEASEAGVGAYLTKPLSVYDLDRAITIAIARFDDMIALRESEHRFRTLVEQSATGITIIQDDRIIFANQAAVEFTGYTAEELLALSPETFSTIIHPGDYNGGITQFVKHLENNPDVLSGYDYRIITPTGQIKWVTIFASQIELGGAKATIASFLDITARKQAETELEKHRAHLEALVQARTAELQAANERLQELSLAKDEFVSNVSHELRTPISNFKVYHDLLQRNPDRIDTYLKTLRRETARLEHIINGLLFLSRLDQQRAEWHLSLTDLNQLAAQYVSDRALLAESQGLTLAFDGEPDLPRVQADEQMIGQAFSVLLTNALNYTPAGGQIVVSTKTRKTGTNAWVGLCVSDTGPGIPPDEQALLFERFFRGEAGRRSGAPGTGLGLAIAKEIIDWHEGEIEILSDGTPGKGTTFSMWLPSNTDTP
jgi:PAS domain S-box-containing protein